MAILNPFLIFTAPVGQSVCHGWLQRNAPRLSNRFGWTTGFIDKNGA